MNDEPSQWKVGQRRRQLLQLLRVRGRICNSVGTPRAAAAAAVVPGTNYGGIYRRIEVGGGKGLPGKVLTEGWCRYPDLGEIMVGQSTDPQDGLGWRVGLDGRAEMGAEMLWWTLSPGRRWRRFDCLRGVK